MIDYVEAEQGFLHPTLLETGRKPERVGGGSGAVHALLFAPKEFEAMKVKRNGYPQNAPIPIRIGLPVGTERIRHVYRRTCWGRNCQFPGWPSCMAGHPCSASLPPSRAWLSNDGGLDPPPAELFDARSQSVCKGGAILYLSNPRGLGPTRQRARTFLSTGFVSPSSPRVERQGSGVGVDLNP